MITTDNLKNVLEVLGFKKQGNVYALHYSLYDCAIKVDFVAQKIIYPTDKGLKIDGHQTTNFDKNENFVVLECVHRLLEKGYKPEHIRLEPKWTVGLGASGGRADIFVSNQEDKPLLMIECKTAGKEFDKATKSLFINGGQLFTYIEQEKATEFVCLYASDFDEKKQEITAEQRIVSVKDNEKILRSDSKLRSFKEADNVIERYQVWKNTYQLEYTEGGIFEADIPAYSIGKEHYKIEDLHIIDEKDIQKKYHEFATILRQYNVSGRENAFDKLVNLFLAKIVDEKHNPNKLQFRWRGIAVDDYYSFIDRLEKLYTNGMKEFLKEEVTFVEQQTVLDAFKFFVNDPDATRETVLKHFRRQKYFTNNDFSFIDVHNEKLFYQNVIILRKIVQMIENIQLNGDQQNQFLGDLFEGFLDRGVKQSEGQFFTPMPIVKFILMSLPLRQLVENSSDIPKAIDYACGAGHFLTELAAQLKNIVAKTKTELTHKDYYGQLYGIEKEYRLSKVAKVSAFMYSQDDINIYYADALTPHENIKNESFDLLVANPPFAVKGFLETLTEEERANYTLSQQISDLTKNNNIQCFFLERAKQLLKVKGMTGIIVPSSVLSNADTTHIATREMLLQFFDIVALTEFGNRTFGKTGTNTTVLFLRKKDDNPPPHIHYKERVDVWFALANDKDIVYADNAFLQRYCQHIDVELTDYQLLLHAVDDAKTIEPLMQYDMFQDYKAAFKKTEDKIKELQQKEFVRKQKEGRSKYVKEQPSATPQQIADYLQTEAENLQKEHTTALDKAFISYLKNIEKDKVYYFVLAVTNPQKVLIVKSPLDNTAQKKFLGYEWSGAKGNEGIKYLANNTIVTELEEDEDARIIQNLNAKRAINTPLFDNNDLENSAKINYYIQQNFLGNPLSIPEHLQPFMTHVFLEDLLRLKEKTFDKKIWLTPESNTVIETQWDIVKLASVISIIGGGTPNTNNSEYWDGDIPWLSVADFNSDKRFVYTADKKITELGLKNSSTKYLDIGDLIISARGTVGALAQIAVPMTFNQSCYGLRAKSVIDSGYLYYILKQEVAQFKDSATGITFGAITINTFNAIKIPLPPLSIQALIVAECEAVEAAIETADKIIEDAKRKIDEAVEFCFKQGYNTLKLESLCDIKGGKRVPKGMTFSNEKTDYPYIRVIDFKNKTVSLDKLEYISEGIFNEIKNYTISCDDVYISIAGTIGLVGTVPIELNNKSLTENAAKFIIKDKDKLDKHFLVYILNNQRIQDDIKIKTGGIGVPKLGIYQIAQIKIPVPPLSIQTTLVAEIEQLEQEIAASQAIIANAAALKAAILKKYL